MNVVDLLLVVIIFTAVIGGWRLGLITRVASWIGALAGMYLAMRVLPTLVAAMGSGPPLTRLFVIIATFLLSAALGGALGEVIGHRLRRLVAPGPARYADRTGGALAGAAGILVGIWLLLPVLAEAPGSMARFVRTSEILALVDEKTPTPPDAMRAMRNYLGDDRFPEVFAGLEPAPDTGPPPSQIPLSAEALSRAVASTVNVETEGCGARHEGSGFTVGDDTIVTNAHVVAGSDRIRVRRPDQRVFDAEVVVFDDNRDIAILRAPGVNQRALSIASAPRGTEGVVIGYPGGQNTPRPAPTVINDERPTVGYDIYNEDRVRRQVLFLASSLRQGDSGGALVDTAGRVIGVAFAIAPDRPGTAYALDDSELRAALAAPRTRGAGKCQ